MKLPVITDEILDIFFKISSVLVIIHREKICLANSYVEKLLEYSEKELRGASYIDLLYEERDKEIELKEWQKRKEGKQFVSPYYELALKTKSGKKIFVSGLGFTVLYKDKICSLKILADVSKSLRIERINKVLTKISKNLLHVKNEKEIWETFCKILKEDFLLDWVIWADIEKFLNFKHAEGVSLEEIKTFNFFDVFSFQNIECISTNDLKDGAFKEFLVSNNIKSFCAIPLVHQKDKKSVLFLASKEVHFFVEEFKDILETLKREIEKILEKLVTLRKEILCTEIFKNLNDMIAIIDENGKFVITNEVAKRILNYIDKKELEEFIKDVKAAVKSRLKVSFYLKPDTLKSVINLPIRKFRVKNQYYWFNFETYAITLSDERLYYVLIGKDVTKEVIYEKQLEKLKYKDELTGVLNYEGFVKKIQEALEVLKDYGILILIDLWNFSSVNTVYGYSEGDRILKLVAERLAKKFLVVGRIVADTFGIFVPDIKDKNEVCEIIKKVKEIIQEPIKMDKEDLVLEFNAGVAIYPDDGKDWDTLWRNSNVALFQAKSKGPNNIEFFDIKITKKVSEYLEVQQLINKALNNKWFVFHYQPYFRISDFKVVGLEALVRIKLPNGELIYPGKFIDFLENSPYLEEFELWAVEEIISKIAKFQIPISLNMSIQSFKRPEQIKKFLNSIEKNINKLGIEIKHRITVEITERILAEHLEQVKELASFFKQKGIKIAIDDFGTGYSSLNYVKHIPLDILKIDNSFVKDVLVDKRSRELIDIIIKLARTFDVKVIAEGVEEEEQLKILKELNCDYVQGYLLAKPVPEDVVEANLLSNKWVKADD